MSRGQGRLFRPKVRGRETSIWWMDYSVRGTRYRESTEQQSKKDAQRILRDRLGQRETGKLVGSPDRLTFATMRELIVQQYQIDGRRSGDRLQGGLQHLEAFFGAEARALELTPARRDAYASQRLTAGASRATVNYELAALRRMERLAVEKGLLATAVRYRLPKVHNERQGFFESGDAAALLVELPAYLRAPVHFALLTGWRLQNEVLSLTWDVVDWEGHTIRIAQAGTKSGEARLFPFGAAPELLELLKQQWEARKGLFVFHHAGRRILDCRSAWKNACTRAGLGGRRAHDMRRTAARDLRRAGISEGEIMKLCGWRTRSMFDRYNIIDEADLAAAVAKRFNGKPAANSSHVPDPAETLS